MDKKRKLSSKNSDFKSKKRKCDESEKSSDSKNNGQLDCPAGNVKIGMSKKMKKKRKQKLTAVEKTDDKITLPKKEPTDGPTKDTECSEERKLKITPFKKKKKFFKKKKGKCANDKNSTPGDEMRTADTGNAKQSDKKVVKKKSVKHKKKAGKKQDNIKTDKKVKTKVTAPSSGIEMSSNWKALAATLNINIEKKITGSQQEQTTEKPLPEKTEEKVNNKGDSPEIWFDDVDPLVVQACANTKIELQSRNVFQGLTRCLALDCEMVGAGLHGKDNELARVSLVNQYGVCVYDKYVKPREKVTDYRTAVSGIKPEHIKIAEDFETVQKEVADLLKGRILVGHALHNDMKVLYLSHQSKYVRVTARYKPFRTLLRTNRPGLKRLAKEILHVSVQEGEHSSVQDAQAAMKLYMLHKKDWDSAVSHHGNKANQWTKEKKSKSLP